MTGTIKAVDRLSAPELDIDANFKQTHVVRAGASIRLFIAYQGRPTPTAVWSKPDSNLSIGLTSTQQIPSAPSPWKSATEVAHGEIYPYCENNSGSKSITFTVKVLDSPGPPGLIPSRM